MAAAGGAVITAAAWRRARAGSPGADGRGRPAPPPLRAGRAARRRSGGRPIRPTGTATPAPSSSGRKRTAPSPTACTGTSSASEPRGERGGRERGRREQLAVAVPDAGEHLAAARVEHRGDARPARAPAASAASEETGASGSPRPCASARAVAIPIRRPVKPPGPTPTAIRSTSSQPTPPSASACSSSGSSRAAWSPREPVGRVVARLDDAAVGEQHAGDGGRRGRVDRDEDHAPRTSIRRRSPPACASVTWRAMRAAAEVGGGLRALGPLDERDRVGAEVRVEQPGVLVLAARRAGRGRGARAGPSRAVVEDARRRTSGLVTASVTPSARSAPRTNVVLPGAEVAGDEHDVARRAAARPARRPARSVAVRAVGLARRAHARGARSATPPPSRTAPTARTGPASSPVRGSSAGCARRLAPAAAWTAGVAARRAPARRARGAGVGVGAGSCVWLLVLARERVLVLVVAGALAERGGRRGEQRPRRRARRGGGGGPGMRRTIASQPAIRSPAVRSVPPHRAAGARSRPAPARRPRPRPGLAAAQLAANGIAVIFTAVFARVLGREDYGVLAAALSSFLIFSVPGLGAAGGDGARGGDAHARRPRRAGRDAAPLEPCGSRSPPSRWRCAASLLREPLARTMGIDAYGRGRGDAADRLALAAAVRAARRARRAGRVPAGRRVDRRRGGGAARARAAARRRRARHRGRLPRHAAGDGRDRGGARGAGRAPDRGGARRRGARDADARVRARRRSRRSSRSRSSRCCRTST